MLFSYSIHSILYIYIVKNNKYLRFLLCYVTQYILPITLAMQLLITGLNGKGRALHSIDMQCDIYTNILDKIQIINIVIVYLLITVINNHWLKFFYRY